MLPHPTVEFDPRKIAGIAMITIEPSRVAMNIPRVVFERATPTC